MFLLVVLRPDSAAAEQCPQGPVAEAQVRRLGETASRASDRCLARHQHAGLRRSPMRLHCGGAADRPVRPLPRPGARPQSDYRLTIVNYAAAPYRSPRSPPRYRPGARAARLRTMAVVGQGGSRPGPGANARLIAQKTLVEPRRTIGENQCSKKLALTMIFNQ